MKKTVQRGEFKTKKSALIKFHKQKNQRTASSMKKSVSQKGKSMYNFHEVEKLHATSFTNENQHKTKSMNKSNFSR